MVEREVEYHAGGARMVGLMVRPDGDGPFPVALVAHEANGLSDHTRTVARRLTALGILAFACDYQGDGRAKTDIGAVTAQVFGWYADPTEVVERMQAALAVLHAEPGGDPARTAAMGYCFGGAAVLDLARTGVPLAAIVGFHPGLGVQRPDESKRIAGPVLMFLGGRDEITPAPHRRAFEDEMAAAGVDWRTVTYGVARHSFTNPAADAIGIPTIAYDRAADTASWRTTLDFLAEKGVMPASG